MLTSNHIQFVSGSEFFAVEDESILQLYLVNF